MVYGKTGKHFVSGDASSLAEALTWALELSTQEREEIGKAAIEYVKNNFTKEIMCNKTIAVYNELVNM
ncbi:MAG: glycosyltransferase [Alphaproteobacteria bacterium]|nr:glycosyltransferase [Alphaproteobacteria bacterium]